MSHALDVLSLAFPDDDLASISAGILPRFADPRTISPMEQSQYVATQVAAGNFLPGTAETLRELPLSEEDVQLHVQANTKARNAAAVNNRINGADDPVSRMPNLRASQWRTSARLFAPVLLSSPLQSDMALTGLRTAVESRPPSGSRRGEGGV